MRTWNCSDFIDSEVFLRHQLHRIREKAINICELFHRVKEMRNQTPFLLCLIAGLLFIAANYTNGVATIIAVYFFLHGITTLSAYFVVIDIILFILWIIAWSGGFAIIIGGYLLTAKHVRLGKFIIAIAAGFGLISLILVILWVQINFGVGGLLVLTWLIWHSAWAIAIILTIIARNLAK